MAGGEGARVAGSLSPRCGSHADVAQLAERIHGKDGAAGSIPAIGSSRDVAQSGSAPVWVTGGRRFDPGHPDDMGLDSEVQVLAPWSRQVLGRASV